MPATSTELNPTKAELRAAVMDLTDEQIVKALQRVDLMVKRAFETRAAYAWPEEARRNLIEALAERLRSGRVRPKG